MRTGLAAFIRARLQTPGRRGAVIDMTREDCSFRPADGGQRGSVACWNGRPPREGDYLILRDGTRSSRYRVTSVGRCLNADPQTMWMASVAFAPRPAGEAPWVARPGETMRG